MNTIGKMFKSINPFTQLVIAEHEVLTNSQLDQKLQLSELAFRNWRNSTFQERADKMKKLANILRTNKDSLGLLITNEMGKILPEAIAEVEKSAENCEKNSLVDRLGWHGCSDNC